MSTDELGIKLQSTMDAQVWAAEFAKLFEGGECPDEGTMLGWFANAIMVGHDHARRQHEKPSVEFSDIELQQFRIWRDVLDRLAAVDFDLDTTVSIHQGSFTFTVKCSPNPGFELMELMARVYARAPAALGPIVRRILNTNGDAK